MQPQAFYELLLWNENYIKCALNLFMYSVFFFKNTKAKKNNIFFCNSFHSNVK